MLPHFEVCQGSGPHLLLVHGMLSSRAQWAPNLAALSRVCRPVRLLGTVVHAALGPRLRENRVPALLVCGTRETRFRPLRDAAEKSMPWLEIADLDGGHSVNLDAAGAFDRVAAAFIARHA